MIYYTILYYTILYYTILYYTILYYTSVASWHGAVFRPPCSAKRKRATGALPFLAEQKGPALGIEI